MQKKNLKKLLLKLVEYLIDENCRMRNTIDLLRNREGLEFGPSQYSTKNRKKKL
jgi:hypothetical protein